MPYFSRKTPRIPGFDYSSENYYFVTVCTHEKACIFGSEETLNEFGKIAWEELNSLQNHYSHVKVDQFIVMPNHIHAIIILTDGQPEQTRADLNTVIGQYKSGVSRKIHKKAPGLKVWQRSYHDHVIRSQSQYEKIWQYVRFNWQKWEEDCFYPGAVQK